MKTINNKKGSAILWCVLLTVIVTILLGSIMTAAYSYYTYTMYTVKRQQAYFTCRSAIDAIISQVANQDDPNSSDYLALPAAKSGGVLTLTDAQFVDKDGNSAKLGEIVEATITEQYVDHQEQYVINVTSKYAGEEYFMSSVIMKQPLYFAGVAIKEIEYQGTSKAGLTLGKNTDLYWNNKEIPYRSKLSSGNFEINLYGNLVSKGDAYIYKDSVVAGHTFDKNSKFTSTSSTRKHIWNSSEYLLSNKELVVGESKTDYNEHWYKTITGLDKTNRQYCNNNKKTAAMSPGGKFGGPYTIVDEITGAVKNTISGALTGDVISSIVDEIENIISDASFDSNALENSSNDGLAIHYIRFMSLSNVIKQNYTTITGPLQRIEKALKNIGIDLGITDTVYSVIDSLGFTVMDISYIGYDATNRNTWSDNVVPVVYTIVDNGLWVRVQTGQKPGNQSISGKLIDRIGDVSDQLISKYLNVNKNLAYVIVYLDGPEEGKDDLETIIELGCPVGRPKNVDESDLIFAYSIYGGDNSTVILNDGVTVLGEIICDKLIIKGDVNIAYSTSNGSQVAKQKVDEYWTVVSYDDSDKRVSKDN